MRQQGVLTDVERHTEECIGGALIKLAMKHGTSCGQDSVFDLELKQRVTRRKVDIVAFAGIPAADDQATRMRIRLDLVDESCNLIDAVSGWVVTPEGAPEVSINGTQVT